MEVLSKEKKKVKGVSLNGNELFEVQQAVQKVLETSTSMKGYYVRILLANLERLDPTMLPVVDAHSKIVLALTKKDDAGNPVRTQAGFEFDNEEDKKEYEAKTAELFEKKKYNVEFVKMSYTDFDNMPINTAENSKIFLVLKYLVE